MRLFLPLFYYMYLFVPVGFGWPALSQIVTSNVDPSRAGTTWSILVTVSPLP